MGDLFDIISYQSRVRNIFRFFVLINSYLGGLLFYFMSSIKGNCLNQVKVKDSKITIKIKQSPNVWKKVKTAFYIFNQCFKFTLDIKQMFLP